MTKRIAKKHYHFNSVRPHCQRKWLAIAERIIAANPKWQDRWERI